MPVVVRFYSTKSYWTRCESRCVYLSSWVLWYWD